MIKNSVAVALLTILLASAATAASQDAASVLKPPKGSEVALVVFEDLECPDCRRANPLVHQAAKTYNIPIVVHDFPLPMHAWAYNGALIAKYFDSQSKELGGEFRTFIYENQPEITAANLRGYAEKFAQEHKVDLPFVVDPQGKLAAEIGEERQLGQRVGIEHTPTIYVVSNKTAGKPFVEVVDRSQLFQLIDAMKRGE
jgi:protein-disulfide isomerase